MDFDEFERAWKSLDDAFDELISHMPLGSDEAGAVFDGMAYLNARVAEFHAWATNPL